MSAPNSRLELRVSCHKLFDLDVLSKSDPQVHLFQRHNSGRHASSEWTKVGQTEVINNELNPKFITPFHIDYYFEEEIFLMFRVYDIDNDGSLQDQDYIGETEIVVGDLVSSPGETLTRPLKNPKNPSRRCGFLTVHSEELKSSRTHLKIEMKGVNLDQKNWVLKSDAYVKIFRVKEDGNVLVHQTEVRKHTLNPHWKPFTISLQKLCNCDEKRPLLFDIHDWNRFLSHVPIGSFQTTVEELESKREFNLDPPMGTSGSSPGKIVFDKYEKFIQPSFLDYIAGGCEINLMVAIDFTGSNGNPSSPASLHHIGRTPNQYVQAITSVGSILSHYDADNLFPCFGFGAVVPPERTANFCFPLNGNPQDPSVRGVEGILHHYHQILPRITLSGPTNMTNIIETAAKYASETSDQDTQKYLILLILTDGVISDLGRTTTAIVKASGLPLSIVIIGVGDADFKSMEFLDSDDSLLTAPNGQKAHRDIVQFVPFRKFKNGPYLASEVLAEIPAQLVGWFQSRNIKPNPPRPAASISLSYSQVPAPHGSNYPPQQPTGHGYPPQQQPQPHGSGYPPQQGPSGQGYPPQGQGYPPQGQGYPPQGQNFHSQVPPPGQGYPPPGQGYPPPGQGYPPPSQGYPPPGQGYPPPGQGYPPQGQGYPPQGYPPPGQGYPPQGQGYPPQGQSFHSQQGPPPGQGYPHQYGSGYPNAGPSGQSQGNPPPYGQAPCIFFNITF